MKHIIFTYGVLEQYIKNKSAIIIPKKKYKCTKKKWKDIIL